MGQGIPSPSALSIVLLQMIERVLSTCAPIVPEYRVHSSVHGPAVVIGADNPDIKNIQKARECSAENGLVCAKNVVSLTRTQCP
jgi:hypothetical protein